jgi:hypothetical protein
LSTFLDSIGLRAKRGYYPLLVGRFRYLSGDALYLFYFLDLRYFFDLRVRYVLMLLVKRFGRLGRKNRLILGKICDDRS